LKLDSSAPATFVTPKSGEQVEITGTVEAVSSVPRPGSVPYQDHITAVHVSDDDPELQLEEPVWGELIR
jgi:alginate O-acetyltransferase complex protein AlgJ